MIIIYVPQVADGDHVQEPHVHHEPAHRLPSPGRMYTIR